VTHPLVAALASRDAGERARACRDAVDDPAAVVLLDSLATALGDPVPRVAMAAADAYAAIGAVGGDCDEALRRSLRSGPPNARWAAAFAAAQLAPPSPRLLPALVEALACDDGAIRWRAARLLVDAASVLPEVEPMLSNLAIASDADSRIRRMAVHALRRLAPEVAEKVCLKASKDTRPEVRRAAASALATCPGPAVATRLLEMAAGDDDEAAARLAISALASLAAANGEDIPPQAVDVLRRIAERRDVPERGEAARGALQRIHAAGVGSDEPPGGKRESG